MGEFSYIFLTNVSGVCCALNSQSDWINEEDKRNKEENKINYPFSVVDLNQMKLGHLLSSMTVTSLTLSPYASIFTVESVK